MIRTLIISCLVVSAAAARAHACDPTVVVTDAGAVQGSIASDGLRSFQGIPYAAPPVGDLRWRAPQRVTPWSGVRAATQFVNNAGLPFMCSQPPSIFYANQALNEDCLYLNVYSPTGATFDDRVPVMVFIHGGGFFFGSSKDLNVATLADKGSVVTVSINYRLGQFGFVAHPALDLGGPASGNYGFLDQQFALAWVQRNIAAFGGDPNKVTIFGESAGGMSVAYHQISPGSAGLFRQAIIESGPTLLFPMPTLAQAEALVDGAGRDLAAALGCSSTPAQPRTLAQIASCLRSADPQAVLNFAPPSLVDPHFLPVVDGQILPLGASAAYRSGRYNHVPLVVGGNHDEGRLGVALLIAEGFDVTSTPSNYEIMLDLAFGQPPPPARSPLTTALLEGYPLSAYPSASDAISAAYSDAHICSTHEVMQLTGAQDRVFAYEFDDQNAPELPLLGLGRDPTPGFAWKAYHTAELQYLSEQWGGNGFGVGLPPPFTPAQWQLADQMIEYWTTFAWSAHPDGASPRWATYYPPADNILSLAPQATAFISSFASDHQCAFWNSLGFYQ